MRGIGMFFLGYLMMCRLGVQDNEALGFALLLFCMFHRAIFAWLKHEV